MNGGGWGRPDGSHGDGIGEAVWSLLKWAMASFAAPDLASLVRIVKRKLKKIQYGPTWSTAASPRPA